MGQSLFQIPRVHFLDGHQPQYLVGIAHATQLQALGFRLVIFPNLLTRVMAKAALEALAALKLSGSSAELAARMLSFSELNRLLGLEDLLDLADRFSPKESHS